jgi:hypothetical protein
MDAPSNPHTQESSPYPGPKEGLPRLAPTGNYDLRINHTQIPRTRACQFEYPEQFPTQRTLNQSHNNTKTVRVFRNGTRGTKKPRPRPKTNQHTLPNSHYPSKTQTPTPHPHHTSSLSTTHSILINLQNLASFHPSSPPKRNLPSPAPSPQNTMNPHPSSHPTIPRPSPHPKKASPQSRPTPLPSPSPSPQPFPRNQNVALARDSRSKRNQPDDCSAMQHPGSPGRSNAQKHHPADRFDENSNDDDDPNRTRSHDESVQSRALLYMAAMGSSAETRSTRRDGEATAHGRGPG